MSQMLIYNHTPNTAEHFDEIIPAILQNLPTDGDGAEFVPDNRLQCPVWLQSPLDDYKHIDDESIESLEQRTPSVLAKRCLQRGKGFCLVSAHIRARKPTRCRTSAAASMDPKCIQGSFTTIQGHQKRYRCGCQILVQLPVI